jgi:hypothetical protein
MINRRIESQKLAHLERLSFSNDCKHSSEYAEGYSDLRELLWTEKLRTGSYCE